MEHDKWVHGMCRPDDAVRETRFGCGSSFALFRRANEETRLGIGWRAKLLKGHSVEEKRGKRMWDPAMYFSVSASLTGSVFVRRSVRMTETSIS